MNRRTIWALSLLALPAVAFALDARSMKEGAITALAAAKTGVPRHDRKIDDAIAHIRQSLALKDGRALFVAEDRIARDPIGREVFEEERRALESLAPLLEKDESGDEGGEKPKTREKDDEKDDDHAPPVPAATREAIARVAADLATADRRIAARAIDLAASVVGTNTHARERLEEAREKLARGDRDATKKRWREAISLYEAAWRNAERAVLAANPPPQVFDVAPTGFVRTNQPLIHAVIETVLDLQTLDPKSIALLIDGTVTVDGASGLRTSAITIDAFGGRATIALQAPTPLGEGPHTATVRARASTHHGEGEERGAERRQHGEDSDDDDRRVISVERSWDFFVDTVPPQVQLSPQDGSTIDSETPTLSVNVVDPQPSSGLASVQIFFDGADVTASFTGPTNFAGGTASLSFSLPDAQFLSQGSHVLKAVATDRAGNVATAVSTFVVDTHPVALAIAIAPSPPARVVAGSLNDLTVRAVTAHGSTSRQFRGLVSLACTDRRSPLDGLVLDFQAANQGSVTIAQIAAFLTAGVQTVTARSLPPAVPLTGSFLVTVVPGPPAALVFTQGGFDQHVLVSEPPAPFAVAVDDAFGNQRSDTGTSVVATVAPVDPAGAPLVLTSAIDRTGVAAFALPTLPVATYQVTVAAPAFPTVPPRTFTIEVVAPPVGDVFLRLPQTPVAAGTTFEAPLLMNVSSASTPDPGDLSTVLGSYDVCLYFDPTQLTAQSVDVAAPVTSFVLVNLSRPGVVAVSAVNYDANLEIDTSLRGVLELFRVHFRANTAAVSGSTPVGVEVYNATAATVSIPTVRLGDETPRPSASGAGRVVVLGAAPTPDFRILAASPFSTTFGASVVEPLALWLSAPVDPSTIAGSVTLTSIQDGSQVALAFDVRNGGTLVLAQPQATLSFDTTYALAAATSLRGRDGTSLAQSFTSGFVTDQNGIPGPADWFTGYGISPSVNVSAQSAQGAAYLQQSTNTPGATGPNHPPAPPSYATPPFGVPAGTVGPPTAATPPQPNPPAPGHTGFPPAPAQNASNPATQLPGPSSVLQVMGSVGIYSPPQQGPLPPAAPPGSPPTQINGHTPSLNPVAVNAKGFVTVETAIVLPPNPVVSIAGLPPFNANSPGGNSQLWFPGVVFRFPGFPEGTYTLQYVQVGAGATAFRQFLNLQGIYDNTPPTISSASLAQRFSQGNFTVNFAARDANPNPNVTVSGISFVEVSEVGKSTTPVHMGYGGQVSVQDHLSITLKGEGPHQLQIRVMDLAGNSATSSPNDPNLVAVVDTTSPALSVDPVSAFAQTSVTFTGTAIDDRTPNCAVQLFRHGPQDSPGVFKAVGSPTLAINAPALGFTGGFVLSDTPPAEGQYDYKIWATDEAGNATVQAIRSIIIDHTKPVGTLSASPTMLSSTTQAVTLNYTFSDPTPAGVAVTSGIGKIELHRVGRLNPTDTTILTLVEDTNPASQFPTVSGARQDVPPSDDYYTYYGVATDRAGNPSDKVFAQGIVVRDTTPPRVTLAPQKLYLNSLDSSIVGVITDLTSVTNIQLLVNGIDRTSLATTQLSPTPTGTTATVMLVTGARFGDGPLQITLSAQNAAGLTGSARFRAKEVTNAAGPRRCD